MSYDEAKKMVLDALWVEPCDTCRYPVPMWRRLKVVLCSKCLGEIFDPYCTPHELRAYDLQ